MSKINELAKNKMKLINLERLPTPEVFLKKCFIMTYAGIISFFIALFVSNNLHKFVAVKYSKTKSTIVNFLNLFKTITAMLISYYCIRQIMEIIPYPLHNPPMFDVYRVREIKGSVILGFAFYIYLAEDLLSYKDMLTSVIR